ncbi:hypothetical protein [Lentibacillus cibarius]|uniref:DUF4935 domain-containing protein n=1 Tax=Lentibacillus cibarius TaxID=2583219 RepID=A0A5S3QLF7_9BACI|nr:hypothetical protein [Lentibacillus cibarius]TMN22609.1 hypothetical protein FFL34_11230 [Lentibacillus cibarius]
MSPNFSKFPICDADMWVYLYLSDFLGRVLQKHEKIVFADVVEQEILAWERNNNKDKNIATFFRQCKNNGDLLVIQHELHIDIDDRDFLEQALKELSFTNGLENNPKEKNKGEFVSALYADHFEMPFMKTNDNAFQEGGKGRSEFPELKIKNWYDIVEEFAINQDEKIRIRKIVDKEQKRMNRQYEKLKEEDKKQINLQTLAQMINKKRL